MKIYKSKIGWETILLFILIFGWSFYNLLQNIDNTDSTKFWTVSAVLSCTILLIAYLLFSIRYKIDFDQKELQVKIGIFNYAKVSIPKIYKLAETRTILSSPAASLDRLEISYHKFNTVIISPKEKEKFIQDLLHINPDIEVSYRK